MAEEEKEVAFGGSKKKKKKSRQQQKSLLLLFSQKLCEDGPALASTEKEENQLPTSCKAVPVSSPTAAAAAAATFSSSRAIQRTRSFITGAAREARLFFCQICMRRWWRRRGACAMKGLSCWVWAGRGGRGGRLLAPPESSSPDVEETKLFTTHPLLLKI